MIHKHEWLKTLLRNSPKAEYANLYFESLVGQIQLDAFKAGAEWAATRMKAESMLYSSVGITRRAMNSCHEQIEFVVANLKEIPK